MSGKTYGELKNPFNYDIPKMFQPQVEWLKDYEGNIVVDKILKMEYLSEDFKQFAVKIGIKKKLPHLNKTKKENYRKYYDGETKAIVEKWFKEDIKRFSYPF